MHILVYLVIGLLSLPNVYGEEMQSEVAYVLLL